MTVLQQPDAFSFSAGMKDIIISSQDTVIFILNIPSGIVLQETYTADAEGKIYIRDLGKLCQSYISPVTLREQFTMKLLNVETNAVFSTINITVQYSNVVLDISAEEFLEDRFLSLLDREKIIYREQKEFLSLVVPAQTDVKAVIRRKSGVFENIHLTTISQINTVITIDVSPSIFTNPETITYYTILAGDRPMTYYIRPEPTPGVQFIFLNSFGVKETFIPSGLINHENKYENSFGTFAGKYRKYFIDFKKLFTANTGVIDDNHATWLEELFMSKDVFLLSPSGIENEITIEEATVKRTSAREELPAYEFKYRDTKINHYEFVTKRSRIFDETFNYTFN